MHLAFIPLTLGLLTVTPSPKPDTPTTTLDLATTSAVFPAAAESQDLCTSYSAAAMLLTVQLNDFETQETLTDVLDAYFIVSFEDAGGFRLTPEARDFVRDYLHACPS